MSSPRVLHVRNVANIGAILSKAQRGIGIDSTCIQLLDRIQGFKADINIGLSPIYGPMDLYSRWKRIRSALDQAGEFDVFHLHDGGILPFDIDVRSRFKKRGNVCVHWHGSKLRSKGERMSKYADAVFVSTPDLLDHVKEATWIPNPIDTSAFTERSVETQERKNVVAVHAPTSRSLKGTDRIISAVKELQRSGVKIELDLVEGRSYPEVIKAMSSADLIIDQVNPGIGAYGMVSVEAMALSKPVVCYLDERFLSLMDGVPIVSPRPDDIASSLKELVVDPALRSELGTKGREYVIRNHDSRKVAEQVALFY